MSKSKLITTKVHFLLEKCKESVQKVSRKCPDKVSRKCASQKQVCNICCLSPHGPRKFGRKCALAPWGFQKCAGKCPLSPWGFQKRAGKCGLLPRGDFDAPNASVRRLNDDLRAWRNVPTPGLLCALRASVFSPPPCAIVPYRNWK